MKNKYKVALKISTKIRPEFLFVCYVDQAGEIDPIIYRFLENEEIQDHSETIVSVEEIL
jgi:hypothetical protein